MGYIKHETLLAISWDDKQHAKAAEWLAGRADQDHFALSKPLTNGYWTLICFPDGSKEGWPESDEGDRRRHEMEEFVAQLDPYAQIVYLSVDEQEYVCTNVRRSYLDEHR